MQLVVAILIKSRPFWLFCGVALLLWASPARAQTPKGLLLAEPQPLSSKPRSNGPIPLIWRITNEGAGLLEGSLDVVIRDGSSVLGRVQVTDLVLTTGTTEFNTMLPTVAASNQFNSLELTVRFLHEAGRIDLGKHTLRAPGPWERSLVACICTPNVHARGQGQSDIAEGIRLEKFHPDVEDKRLVTSRTSVLPDEMPTDPLFYCGFDLVVLAPDGFAQLEQKQLDALREWVAAGGSVLAFGGRTLAPAHVAFLNALFGDESNQKPFLLDATGRLLEAQGDASAEIAADAGIRLAEFGLGRAALGVAPSLEAVDVESAQWRKTVAFLWKIRQEQLRPVVRRGTWDLELMRAALGRTYENQYQQTTTAYPQQPDPQQFEALLFAQETIKSGDQLLRYLMPNSVRVVPWWLIGLVLLAYVVVIGPGDYVILGLFRRRKLTWFVFPLVTLGFTLFAIWLSHYYMRTTDVFKSIIFLDVGQDGAVVRQNQFELIFAGTRRTAQTDVRRGMFTPLNHLMFGNMGYYGGGQSQEQDSLVGATTYAGRVPYLYSALQDVPQWTPQLNRTFTIAPDTEPVEFDWGESDIKVSQIWIALRERLPREFGADVAAWAYRGERVEQIVGGRDVLSEDQFVYTQYGQQRRTNFLKETSVRSGQGLHAVVSRLAPTGGPNFEDLPLLDSSDESQWLLVVAVPRDNDLLVYRKLYTESAKRDIDDVIDSIGDIIGSAAAGESQNREE